MALVTWTSISSSSYTCQSCRMRCQQNALPSKSSSSSIEAMRSFKWRRRWQMGSWGVPHAELQSFWSCVTAALSIVSGQWEAFSRQTKIQRYMLMGEPTTANSTLLRSAIMRKCGTHWTSWPKSLTQLLYRMCLTPHPMTSETVNSASKRRTRTWKTIITARETMPSARKNVLASKQSWATQTQTVTTSWTSLYFKIRPTFSSFNLFLTKICHSTRQYILRITARTD